MRIQTLLTALTFVFGFAAQADDLDLTFYTTPPEVIKSDCELVTQLTKKSLVGRDGKRVTYITLIDAVEGACEIPVDATPRVYVLKHQYKSCGSTIYQADMEGTEDKLTLKDHTTRLCKDIVDAPYILLRAHPQRKYAPLYASKKRVDDGPITHPGPVVELKEGHAIVNALLENPKIVEILIHNNLKSVSQMTRQGTAPGVTVYVLRVVNAGFTAPGGATVTIVEDRRGIPADVPVQYTVTIDILE